ncbi:serine/arginine repetitive matrix protein 2-like [Uloborus diversus]|uniref:serine/arginine repetitive matrix protein 2-like n=1 Tax=Uloborus diversus TaxID=327109 RepID=UPI002409B725|nr:serine/arginine repetitive matrix protein 2-like [Uloborus diversus]
MANNSIPVMKFDASKGTCRRNLSTLQPVIGKNRPFKKFRNAQEPFKSFRYRNPENLHVIYSFDQPPMQQPVLQQIPLLESTGESPVVKESFSNNPGAKLQRKYASAKMRKRRERRRNRRYRGQRNTNYKWFNTDYKVPDLKESVEEFEDVPMDEGDFEEVEVASMEDNKDESKNPKIPVGFRRYMLKYLTYKKKSFFKPKFYHLCHQRTIVNRHNLQEDEPVEVDIVSEAEYEAENSCTEKNDADSEQAGEMTIFEVADDDLTEIETCDEASPEPVEEEKVQKFEGSGVSCLPHVYNKTTVSQDSNSDCYQGPSLIQELLDAWNSHLIGLEYVLEIREKKGISKAESYYCVLCSEDCSAKDTIGVVDHVMCISHIVKYLDRHFASRGYKFSDSNCSEILLQRYCEEINRALGYNFMCITHKDYFKKHKKNVKDYIEKLPHANNIGFGLSFSSYVDVPSDSIDFVNEMLTYIVNETSDMVKSTKICQLVPSVYSDRKVAKKVVPLSEKSVAKERIDVKELDKINTSAVLKAAENTEGKEISNANTERRNRPPRLEASKLRSYLLLKRADNRKQKETTKDGGPGQSAQKPVTQSTSKELEAKGDTTKVVATNLVVETSCTKLQETQSLKKTSSQAAEKVVSQVPQNKSVSLAAQNKSVSLAAQNKSMSQALKNKSVSQAAQNESVSQALKNKSVSQALKNKSVSQALKKKSVSQALKNKSVSQALKNKSVNQALKNKTVSQALKSKSLNQTVKKSVSLAARNELVSKATPDKPVRPLTQKKLVIPSAQNKSGSQAVTKKPVSLAAQNKLVSKATLDKPGKPVTPSKQKNLVIPSTQNKSGSQATQNNSMQHSAPGAVLKDKPAVGAQKKNITGVGGKNSTPKMTKEKIVPQIAGKKAISPKKPLVRIAPTKTVHQVVQVPSSAQLKPAQKCDNDEVVVLKEIVAGQSRPKERVVPSEGPVLEDKSVKVKPQQKTLHSKHCLKRVLGKSSQSRIENSSNLKGIDKSSIKVTVENEKAKHPQKKVIKNEDGVVKVKVDNSKSDSKVSRNRQSPKRIVSKRSTRRSSHSPLRRLSDSPPSKSSRSPSFLSKNSSLERRLSRSPVRYKSPLRLPFFRQQSRSPVRHSFRSLRSPHKKGTRSPHRRHSRSPRRRVSRSPRRRLSRSPRRRTSRSPRRRRSRTPPRHSRSPIRRHSRSPRRHSRSPHRRQSSPRRKFSRSPLRISPRSPPKHLFKDSSLHRKSRSPPSMRSRSPFWNLSQNPVRSRISTSPSRKFDTTYDSKSSSKKHLENIRGPSPMHGKYSGSSHSKKYSDNSAGASSSKVRHNYSPLNFKGQLSKHRAGSDLDPVSDEDESVYFNIAEKRALPQATSQAILLQVLQKLSMPNLNLNDPLVQKYIKFAASHPTELNEMILSRDAAPSFREPQFRNLMPESNTTFPQHHPPNLAPSHSMHPSAVLAGSNIPFLNSPMQPTSQQSVEGPHYSPLSNINKSSFENPLSGRASFPGFGPPVNQFDPLFRGRAQVPAEVMFRDLKAKVNKLFGPKKDEPEPEKPMKTIPDQAPAVWAGPQNFSPKNIFQQKEGTHFSDGPPISAHEPQFFPNPPHVPPPDAKVMFCEAPRAPNRSLFPVVGQDFNSSQPRGKAVADRKYSLAQRLASILIKVGMIDVPAPLLQEMLMKIGAFSSCPPQDIPEGEIVSILKKLGYLSH